MKSHICYCAVDGTTGVVRNRSNTAGGQPPELMMGLPCELRLRLFANCEDATPFPPDQVADVISWSFEMDTDFSPSSAVKLVAGNSDIRLAEITENGIVYTQITIPFPETHTAELAAALDGRESLTLAGELIGYDTDHTEVFILQIKGFTVRGRVRGLGEPTPVSDIAYEALAAAAVNAVIASGGAVTSSGAKLIASGAMLSVSGALQTEIDAASGAMLSVSGALQTEIDAASGALMQRPTSGGVSQIAAEIVASGGFMKQQVEIVSGGSVGYIPVLSGGMCYRFTDPLVSLTIGSVTSSLRETDILFTAGAVVSPPVSVTISYRTGAVWTWDDAASEDVLSATFTTFDMVSSGNGYAPCAVGSRTWYSFSAENWGYGGVDTYYSVLSNGSFTCTSAGGKWVVSAHNISQYVSNTVGGWDDDANEGNGDYAPITSEYTEVLNTWIASSTDSMATWSVNSAVTIGAAWFDDYIGESQQLDATANITASTTVTPCDVVLPSGALLVNSSAVTLESGHRYEMNLKHGAIVTGEWMEASNE